jgi:5-formyltetrahydrofolate cyclo-ligase
MTEDLAATRRHLRRLRAALPEHELSRHTAAIAGHLLRGLRRRPRGLMLAGYFGIHGEVDLSPWLERLVADGYRVAMPMLDCQRTGRMQFRLWQPERALCRNAFGILEPCRRARRVWRRELDLVLLPVVGFDAAGNRLGMGGGYYDRYFARQRAPGRHRPRLVGIAHAFQELPGIPANAWDVPLDAVITELGWRRFPGR